MATCQKLNYLSVGKAGGPRNVRQAGVDEKVDKVIFSLCEAKKAVCIKSGFSSAPVNGDVATRLSHWQLKPVLHIPVLPSVSL